MSWTNELYNVYEQQCGIDDHDGKVLLPVAHSTANAQIEVTLKPDGTFVTARALTKEEGKNTIIPVTIDSGGRTSGVCAMPFADKLIYICGDYEKYTNKKNDSYFSAYIEQLERWNNSRFSHPSVNAVYSYITKKKLMHDLIEYHVLETDEKTGMISENFKIADTSQKDSFVRFRVQGDAPETWLDNTLHKAFMEWNNDELKNTSDNGLCYATGKDAPITYKHPSKIRNTGDKAKLISSNDESGFTYRGRFNDKTEAISVSYDFSQKIHNALRWLIEKQGITFDTMKLAVWTSSLEQPPNIIQPPYDPDDDEGFEEEAVPDTMPVYRDMLKKYIYGTKKPDIDPKVMIMGVDAATTGRLSIAIYEEILYSRLMDRLIKWHSETACLQRRHKRYIINSFALLRIIDCAYGAENSSGKLETKPEIIKENILRLIPCITMGRKLPVDIVRTLVNKASKPFGFEKHDNYHNHQKTIEVACGMIRKHNIDRKKGVTCMSYDKNETDRSYLFGCLLAIANAAEYASYEEADKGKRITNAKRLWNRFVSRPSSTWAELNLKLNPYMDKLGAKSIRYTKMIDEVMSKFNMTAFSDNSPLKPAYLLGYHHFNAEIYKTKANEEE